MQTNKKKEDRPRVCMAHSLYSFMYYLFMSSEEQIRETTYFFTRDIPECVRKNMPHGILVDTRKRYIRENLFAVFTGFWWRNVKYPVLKKADIFGLDFFWWLLRGLKTNYIEDCPNVLDIWETSSLYEKYRAFESGSALKKALLTLLFGGYYRRPVGTSRWVKAIYTSEKYDKPYHQGKKKVVRGLKEAWYSFPEAKKRLILDIFNIDEACMENFNSRSVLLLTQPYFGDKHMTESEHIDTYGKIIAHYGKENVIIKPHPRDKTDYKTIYPGVMVFYKIVPMQLLVLLGADFERIATINSSSALSFGADATIDWWAEQMPRETVKDEGFFTLEEAKKALLTH